MEKFLAKIEIIGVNPYVELPPKILTSLHKTSGKEKGPIQVKGTLQGKPYKQTLVKFKGMWRLYLNNIMREASQTKVGDTVTIEIAFDPEPRLVPPPPQFIEALNKNPKAKQAFEKLPPSHQKEFNRYLSFIKTEETLKKNIEKVLRYLSGEEVKGPLFYKRNFFGT